jgi:spore coat protein JC
MGVYNYRKRFFYPIHVERSDPALAELLLEHYGGKDGELTQVVQYLNHQTNVENRYLKELLGLIAAEELAHLEIIAVVIDKLGGDAIQYINPRGEAWDIRYVNQGSEPISLLKADIALEIQSRLLYEKLLSMTSDPGVKSILGFLARREGIHQSLLNRSRKLLADKGTPDQALTEIIYDYKISLQVLD